MDFSVLLSVYKKEKPAYLKLALDSIWDQQSVKPSQIVIVKDGPLTRELNEELDRFSSNAPVDFVINESNIGLSASLNKGLIACRYNIVARMDTDDIAYPDRFEKQITFLKKNPDVDILGTFATSIDENGKICKKIEMPVDNKSICRLIWTCPIIHPTVMFKKDKISSVGSYNPNSGPRQDDYELWFRCVKDGLIFTNLAQTLLFYRFFSDSVKKNNFKVGWYRFKVGFAGCRKINTPFIAYVGITIPLIRSVLPYPLNIWFQYAMNKINPRYK